MSERANDLARPIAGIDLYSVAEVAYALRCSLTTVYRLVGSEQLASVKVGRHLRIPAAAVHAYLRPKLKAAERSPVYSPLRPVVDLSIWRERDDARLRKQGSVAW